MKKKNYWIFSLFLTLFLVGGVFAQTGDSGDLAKENAGFLAGELDRSFTGRMIGGINKRRVYESLRGNAVYRSTLQQEYERITGASLRSHLNRLGSDGGDEVLAAQLLMDQGRLTTVDKLFLHTHGTGTRERSLFSALADVGNAQNRANIEKEWSLKFGANGLYFDGFSSSVRNTLESELSGDEEELALKMYNNISLTDEELVRVAEITGKSADDIIDKQIEARLGEKREILNDEFGGIILPSDEQVLSDGNLTESEQEGGLALSGVQPLTPADCGPVDEGYRLCVGLPGQARRGDLVAGLGDYIRLLYQFALVIAGLVVFIRIIYGGIKYSFSGGNPGTQKEAWDIITQAIWGLVLLLAAVLILYIVDPRLLDIQFSLKTTGMSDNSFDFNLIKTMGPTTR